MIVTLHNLSHPIKTKRLQDALINIDFPSIMKVITALLLIFSITTASLAQHGVGADVFEQIEMLQPDGKTIRETDVRVRFDNDSITIQSTRSGQILKSWNYSDIRSAEYSYTKNPRWKTGLGLGAAAFVFPPLFLIAIPVGFTKHRRHWVTVRTENDFAVLKVSKSIRKLFIPAFETHTSVRIVALGDDK